MADQLRADEHVYDALIDCVGQMEVWKDCKRYLKEGGIFTALATSMHKYSDIPKEMSSILGAMYLPGCWMGAGGRKFV